MTSIDSVCKIYVKCVDPKFRRHDRREFYDEKEALLFINRLKKRLVLDKKDWRISSETDDRVIIRGKSGSSRYVFRLYFDEDKNSVCHRENDVSTKEGRDTHIDHSD